MMGKQLTRLSVTGIFTFGSAVAWACDHCRPLVESGVYNSDFIANFSLLSLPLLGLVFFGVASHYIDRIGNAANANAPERN